MKRKEVIVTYSFIFAVVALSVFGLVFIQNGFTGFAIYEQSDQSGFDEGAYSNTEWNGSAVVLSSGQTFGNYTSKVFDAGADATWNNLTEISVSPNLVSLFCVDGGGDIYKSTDDGVNWILSQEDFGRTTATEDMFANSNYLYILSSSGNEIWRSPDGTNFAIVNDSFTSSSPLVGDVDSSGNLYVATGPGEVWRSDDDGVTWNYLGDSNNGASNDPKGIAINSTGDLFVVDGAGDVYSSTNGGVDWTKVNDGYGGSTGTDGMDVDSNDDLYILYNYDLYRSTDDGVNWNIINDSFTPYGNVPVEIFIDADDVIYILDAVGRVFESSNFGATWNEIGDCNNGASNDPKGLTNFIQNTDLSFQVKNCSSADCSDASFQSLNLDDLNLGGQYFQYQVSFSSPDVSVTPSLESVSIDYDLTNTAPSVSIDSPENQLYVSGDLNLNYSVSDSDGNLDSCWYTIDAGVTNNTLAGCANTMLSLLDGDYDLIVYANDSYGLESSDSVSFSVDATGVFVSITEPVGTKTSRTEIPIEFSAAGDNLTCWYNVKFSTGTSVIENTTLVGCASSTFDVSADGDYVLNLFANNSYGSYTSDNSPFSVDTSTSSSSSSSSSSSGSSGGGSSSGGGIVSTYLIRIETLPNQIMGAGDTKKLSLNVDNAGVKYVDDCKVVCEGDYTNWCGESETKGLAGGQSYKFSFSLNVPEGIDSGVYPIIVKVVCDKVSRLTNFTVELLEKEIDFELIDVKRISNDEVKITYSLEELSGIDQNVALQFLLLNSENEKVSEVNSETALSSNSKENLEIYIPIDSLLEGDLNLLVNLNSETYSTFVQESVVLGAPTTGFSVFGEAGDGDVLISICLIAGFIVFAVFMIRRILKHRKK